MKNNFSKLAAVLAGVIGAMAIFAAGPVLFGRGLSYNIVGWVPVYNLLMGVVSVFLTAVLLWRGNRWALPASRATFGIHSLVTLVLLTVFREVVAVESLTAMVVRITVWGLILILLWLEGRVSPNRDVPTAG